MEAPSTAPLRLKTLDIDLNVWSGTVRFAHFIRRRIGEQCRPIDEREVELSARDFSSVHR